MISLIGVASGEGAGNKGCGEAPEFLFQHPHLLGNLQHQWLSIFKNQNSLKDPYDRLADLYWIVAKKTYELTMQDQFFMTIGGDHSCAIGTWSGFAEAMRFKGAIGLIWIDAHMDSHTPETSETGNIHGMPLATLMGFGDKRLTSILSDMPKIDPSHVILIGVRSFEAGEEALLKRLGVRIYYMDEVKKRGIRPIILEAIEYISKRTTGYGVSFDLDVIDPMYVKGVGTPVQDGIPLEDILESLTAFQAHPPLAFELVEYNPFLDEDLSTIKVIKEILHRVALFPRSLLNKNDKNMSQEKCLLIQSKENYNL